MVLTTLILICLVLTEPQAAQSTTAPTTVQVNTDSKEQNIRSYIELMRADVRAQKVQIITAVMNLNDNDARVFWPIYREYDLEMSKLGDQKLALIQDYAQNYLTMSNEKADQISKRVFQLDEARADLRKKYYEKFKKALSPVLAARFSQVENQIQLILDLQIESGLPIIEEADSK